MSGHTEERKKLLLCVVIVCEGSRFRSVNCVGEKIIGGMSSPDGIRIDGRTHTLFVQNNGSYRLCEVKDRDNKFRRVMRKIPFIRGIYGLIDIFRSMFSDLFRNMSKRQKILAVGFVGLLCGISFSKISFGFGSTTLGAIFPPGWAQFTFASIAGIITAVVILVLLIFLYATRGNHSTEHKFIYAYLQEKDITSSEISQQKKEHPRCGGTLVAYLLPLGLASDIILGNMWWSWIVIWAVSHELFLLAQKPGTMGAIFSFPGLLVQKLTTKKVEEKDIVPFVDGFKKFTEAERSAYAL